MSKPEPVPYADALELLRAISDIIPPERRRDFQKIAGPFLAYYEQDENAVSLIICDLLDGQEPVPTRSDEKPHQRRERAARNILRHRSAALAIGMDDLPDGLPEAVARDVAMADARLRDWRSGPPEERAERYFAYRRDFE